MKFKAHIKLTDEHKNLYEWRLNKDQWEAPEHMDIEFTFKELLEEFLLNDYRVHFRKILFPWLMDGNHPEIIECEPEKLKSYFKDAYRQWMMSSGPLNPVPRGLIKRIMPSKDESVIGAGVGDIISMIEKEQEAINT
jgi:hypothetical protein